MCIAEKAYQGMLIGPAIEQHMVDSFAEGLLSSQLRMTILRDRPQTLQAAITIAINETNLYNRIFGHHNYIQNKTSYEPMDIDHPRSLRCFKCGNGGAGNKGKDC